MAPGLTTTTPICTMYFRTELANSIVGGPSSLNRSGPNFNKRSAVVTRQVRTAAVQWMTVRESLALAMLCATLEVVLLQSNNQGTLYRVMGLAAAQSDTKTEGPSAVYCSKCARSMSRMLKHRDA